MSLVKILDINSKLLQTAAKEDYLHSLMMEVDDSVKRFGDSNSLSYDLNEMAHLITSIEIDKIKFLTGNLSAKRLYRDVDYALTLFKVKHPEFDYLRDPVLSAYYS